MLARMWGFPVGGNSLLVGMEAGAATMAKSMAAPQKKQNGTTV